MSRLLLFKTCKNFKEDTVKCQDCLARNGCLDYEGVDATIVLHVNKQCVVDFCIYNHETKCHGTTQSFNKTIESTEDCPLKKYK